MMLKLEVKPKLNLPEFKREESSKFRLNEVFSVVRFCIFHL